MKHKSLFLLFVIFLFTIAFQANHYVAAETSGGESYKILPNDYFVLKEVIDLRQLLGEPVEVRGVYPYRSKTDGKLNTIVKTYIYNSSHPDWAVHLLAKDGNGWELKKKWIIGPTLLPDQDFVKPLKLIMYGNPQIDSNANLPLIEKFDQRFEFNRLTGRATADINNDGKTDVIAAIKPQGHDTGGFQVYSYNQKNDTFTLIAKREKFLNSIESVLVCDWNGNSYPDIILSNNQDRSIRIFEYSPSQKDLLEIWKTWFSGYTGICSEGDLCLYSASKTGKKKLIYALMGHCSNPKYGMGLYLINYGKFFEINGSLGISKVGTFDFDNDNIPEVFAGSFGGNIFIFDKK